MYEHTATRPQTSNRILNALTRSEYESLSAHLDPVNLSPREILYRPEQPVTHVYFPNLGAVSLVSTFEDGDAVEVGMLGNECIGVGRVGNRKRPRTVTIPSRIDPRTPPCSSPDRATRPGLLGWLISPTRG